MRLDNFSGLLTRLEIDILHFTRNISQPNCSTAPMANGAMQADGRKSFFTAFLTISTHPKTLRCV
jgi:hypothetical protein